MKQEKYLVQVRATIVFQTEVKADSFANAVAAAHDIEGDVERAIRVRAPWGMAYVEETEVSAVMK